MTITILYQIGACKTGELNKSKLGSIIIMAASSRDYNQLQVQEHLDLVMKVAGEVTDTPEDSLPFTLLKLLPCLQARTLSEEDFFFVKYQVWRQDLVHLMIEVLRRHYSGLPEHWRVLTNLAVLLSSVLANFSPSGHAKKKFNSIEFREEEIGEYRDIVLPTAIDSILILANAILESADSSTTPMQNEAVQVDLNSLKECFKKALDALLWLCAGQKDCIGRVLQSPYFLHILITDNSYYSHISLEVLETLILSDKAAIASIPENVLTNILDEMIYKLSGEEEKGALLSLRLLAQLVVASPNIMEILQSSYSGLLQLSCKWTTKPELASVAAVKRFVEQLEVWEAEHSDILQQEDGDSEKKSAVIIQACWRGYMARKKVERIKRGVTMFQRIYRRRKEAKMQQKAEEQRSREEAVAKESNLRSSKLEFHEKQLTLLEQLPASEFQDYMRGQETEAAIKIQCAWRSWVSRRKYKENKSEALLNKNALVIQRAMRRCLSKKKPTEGHFHSDLLPKITGAEREQLQAEVASYRELHPSTGYKSEQELLALHEGVQKMYEEFYTSRPTQRKDDERARLNLTQLGSNSDVLSKLPTLEQFASEPQPELLGQLLSNSGSVARMARKAHKEELKALNTPWWKLPQDYEELSII